MSLLFCVLALTFVLLVSAAVLVLRMRPEQDVQIVFAKTYLKTYRATRDRKESLRLPWRWSGSARRFQT